MRTMETQIAIVDYGMGNLRSVWQAVVAAAGGAASSTVAVTSEPEVIRHAERVILPGQGAMPDCMKELNQSGLREVIEEAAQNKPFLGVCVGMQMLLDKSEEGDTPSLGWIPGLVKKFQAVTPEQGEAAHKIPQMGWNTVKQANPDHAMWQDVPDGAWFYFVHSYYAAPEQAVHVAATTQYIQSFASVVAKDNLFATQFHPEKSADAGVQLYRNFLNWNP